MSAPTAPEPLRRRIPVVRIAVTVTAAALVALLAYGLLRQAPDTTIDDALASGSLATAPGFDLEVLDAGRPGPQLAAPLADGRLALEELRGVPVVLNFWASWCDPCRQEASLLQREWERARRLGVLFVGLNMQDARDSARAFLREFGVDYPTIREADKRTARAYGASGIPETYFLTADGRVAAHVIGAVSSSQVRAGIDAARTGTPLPVQIGGDRRSTR